MFLFSRVEGGAERGGTGASALVSTGDFVCLLVTGPNYVTRLA